MKKQKDLKSYNEIDVKQGFSDISALIKNARNNALRKVNEELITLYFDTGKYLSETSTKYSFGDKYIDEIAKYIENNHPEIKGFNRRGLYRMKQFYETYKDDQFVSPLVSQITWTNHLLIMSKAKSQEERHFYIQLCIKERYSKRELERQLDSAYFERYMLSKDKLPIIPIENNLKNQFRDSYVLEFLDLPERFSEKDFKQAIIQNLKNFILEVGRDFTYVGEEYKVQVGNEDFYIDLLFYHRGLSCMVAFELKIGKFKPEYIGKMNFYLEALDREHKKDNENPSVGIVLCATKDDEIVEYALSRSLSPTLVAEYTLRLPKKSILQEKLRELTDIAEVNTDKILE